MTPEDVKKSIDDLKELQKIEDYEYSHYEADAILCRCLIKLGFNEIVEEYKKVGKWYA